MSYHRFRRNQKGRLIVGLLGVLLLAACNGGGSGGGGGGGSGAASNPAPTNISFQLFPAGFFSSGYTKTYQLNGSDTVGDTFAGTFTETTQAQGLFNGQPAIPVQGTLRLTNTQTNASVTETGTDYYSIDPANLMYLGFTESAGAVSKAV